MDNYKFAHIWVIFVPTKIWQSLIQIRIRITIDNNFISITIAIIITIAIVISITIATPIQITSSISIQTTIRIAITIAIIITIPIPMVILIITKVTISI